VVTAMDLERSIRTYMNRLPPEMPADERASALREVRARALEELIDNKLFQKEVERLDITVSQREMDMHVERIKKQNNLTEEEFIAQLRRRGLTPEEYRVQLKLNILKHRLINREVHQAVVISDEQVLDYYKKNHGEFAKPGHYTLQAIFLTYPKGAKEAQKKAVAAKADDLRARALKGSDFAELAEKNSQGPGASDGGRIGPLKGEDMLEPMREALKELKQDQISKVLDVGAGVVFFKLLGASGGKGSAMPLGAVKEQIRKELEKKAVEERFKEWLKDLKAKTYIKIIK